MNILDEDTYKTLNPKPTLQQSNTKIVPYGQNAKPLEVLGTFNTRISAVGRTIFAEVHVVSGSCGSILGEESAIKLDLLRVGPPSTSLRVLETEGFCEITKMIKEQYPELSSGIGKLKDFQLRLHIDQNIPPVQQSFRHTPFHTRKKLEHELQRLLAMDIIERVDGPTTWTNPFVLTTRSNNTVRLCVDMRRANEAIIRERHLIPKIDEMLAELHGAKLFSKLDLKDGYHQLELDEDSRDITSFMTHLGMFRFKRLLYGVNVGFEAFQKQMEQVLAGLENVICISDDITIYAENKEQHDTVLKAVLGRLSEHGLTLNLKKCKFRIPEIVFAGFKISADGISLEESRIKTITEMKHPTNATEVLSWAWSTTAANSLKDTPRWQHHFESSPRRERNSSGVLKKKKHLKI